MRFNIDPYAKLFQLKIINIHRCNISLADIIKITIKEALEGYFLRLFGCIELNTERQNIL